MNKQVCEASPVATEEIRVALCCDEPVLVAGLQAVIASDPELRLSCACGVLSDFFAHLEQFRPQVALVDAPPQLSRSTIIEISRRAPVSRIVLWVHSVNIQLAHELKEAGIAGILRKQLSGELIIRCLKKVAAGELWFERELMSSMLGARPVRLSPREQQLVDLISQGLSNKQIASALGISEGTVKVYFSKLFRKVGVSDRFELALFGLQNRRLDAAPADDLRRIRPVLLLDSMSKRQTAA
jgi:two-component system nitrate/nitrite response regulator NarL